MFLYVCFKHFKNVSITAWQPWLQSTNQLLMLRFWWLLQSQLQGHNLQGRLVHTMIAPLTRVSLKLELWMKTTDNKKFCWGSGAASCHIHLNIIVVIPHCSCSLAIVEDTLSPGLRQQIGECWGSQINCISDPNLYPLVVRNDYFTL